MRRVSPSGLELLEPGLPFCVALLLLQALDERHGLLNGLGPPEHPQADELGPMCAVGARSGLVGRVSHHQSAAAWAPGYEVHILLLRSSNVSGGPTQSTSSHTDFPSRVARPDSSVLSGVAPLVSRTQTSSRSEE